MIICNLQKTIELFLNLIMEFVFNFSTDSEITILFIDSIKYINEKNVIFLLTSNLNIFIIIIYNE
jgi:hypothetical protein